MSKEKKDRRDSSEAPPVTPNPELKIESYFICPDPECYSSIEISLVDEENNILNFRCIKSNKKFVMSIKEYLEKIKGIKRAEQLEDKCKVHLKKNTNYCFDCNCHLCDECLKTRIHIHHKKSNIIEVKPIEEEINIIKEVIKDYSEKLENLRKEKNNKEIELKEKEKEEKTNENNILENKKKMNEMEEEKELEINEKNYINDIEEIKKRV